MSAKKTVLLLYSSFFISFLFGNNAENIDSLLNLLKKTKADSTKLILLDDISKYYRENDIRKALDYTKQLEDLAKKSNHGHSIGKSYYSHAKINYDLGMYETAQGYNEMALKIFKDLNDVDMVVRILNNIATLYWVTEKYDIAFKFYQEAYQMCIKTGTRDFLVGATMNMGLTYRSLGVLDSAAIYYRKGLQIAALKKDYYGLGIGSLNLGNLYLHLSEYDSAKYYFDQSFKYKEHIRPSIRGMIYNDLGRFYSQTGNYRKAKYYLDSARIIASNANSMVTLKDFYLASFELDTIRNNLSSAIDNYINYSAIKDSLHTEDISQKLTQFQALYQLGEKESELILLHQTGKLSRQKIKSQRLIILLAIIALLLATILSLILYFYFRSNKKLNKELKDRHKRLALKNSTLLKRERELKESNDSKNKLFSIIAHDIKNPLYSMLRLGDMLADRYEEHSDKKRKEYIHHLNQAGKELVNLTENLLSWSRYQLGNISFAPNYFSILEAVEFARGIYSPIADLKKISLEIDIHPSHMVYADFSMVLVVIRNLTNNSIKFTPRNGKIITSSVNQLDHIKISITDNGIGMTKSEIEQLFTVEKRKSRLGTEGEKGSGLGLALCKEFVEKNNGNIGVISNKNEGSTFWFTLPKEK